MRHGLQPIAEGAMTCKAAAKLRDIWYTATAEHGQASAQYFEAMDAYKAHRQGCMLCKADLQQPKVTKLFEVQVSQ